MKEILNYDKLKYKSNNRFLFRKKNLFDRSREARRRRSAGRRGSDSNMRGKKFFIFLLNKNFFVDFSARGGSKAASSK